MVRIAATFTMKTWDEKPVAEGDGAPKVATAISTNTYSGEISGESTATYVITYPTDTIAVFVGYEQITGTIGDRKGSFLVESRGGWSNGEVTTEWTVVEGAATRDLAGLTGAGRYSARHGEEPMHVELDYALPGSLSCSDRENTGDQRTTVDSPDDHQELVGFAVQAVMDEVS